MRLMLLGAPGAGKGTQAQKLANYFNIPQISTGDMLRQAIKSGSDLGKKVENIMQSGQLVSDSLIINIINQRLKNSDCKSGFLFDGFPRTINQAKALDDNDIKLDHIINLVVDNQEIIDRVTGRRVHPSSGRVYHVIYNPPKKKGVDDLTGEPLIQRPDDKQETVINRLKIYHEQTQPLVDFYQNKCATSNGIYTKFHNIIGQGTVIDIFNKILNEIKQSENKR